MANGLLTFLNKLIILVRLLHEQKLAKGSIDLGLIPLRVH